ncbi:MAG: hypothetical protein H7338_23455 [Candidatus Sericytochromatia bacterium]|nr:hypothetical protein [Candidatus Sericytochromatia bacterium]
MAKTTALLDLANVAGQPADLPSLWRALADGSWATAQGFALGGADVTVADALGHTPPSRCR